jgi:tetratricopeptide (TPR) repeat protein
MLIFSIKDHLKKHFSYIFFFALLIVIISGCSTKKNTWSSRAYQATNTRFNVYFNGYVSYNEGLRNILKANKEDYSGIIPMYPISHHSNATSATTDMDRTIEKCRKAIKLHSIKVKPDKNYKKMNSPEYKIFYNQEEFNPAMKEAWLLLAKAEFHKGDFLGSVGTFSYIARHYSTDKDIIAVCQLWIARAYGEMSWIYEAEQVLSKLEQDNLKHSNIGLFASVNADLLLKKRQYKEAIPFLELALSKENDKDMQQRFGYLLAQLYHKTNDDNAAYDAYSKVIKLNPPYEMDFNARISRAQLNTENVFKVRKELRSMLKNRNNKDYLDQLYYALGNTYLTHGDTLQAIDNYKFSADTSSRKGIDKAVTLITLGDLYYKKREYVLAQPCYDEASKIITNEHEDYARVTRRAETLSELVTQNDIVILQDSLQELSTLSEIKRIEIVNKVIAKVIADEKLAADKVLKDNEARNKNTSIDEDMALMPPIGTNSQGGWYFYNPEIMRSGQTEFMKRWGKRKLEDNWRRTNKATSLFGDESTTTTLPSAAGDTTVVQQKTVVVADNKKPEFYLRQIPVTPAQLLKSNAEIATALFSMGEIYKDKIEDYPMAISTFNEFISRFGSDERVPDAYFYLYMIQSKQGNQTEAERYRTKLITDYPNTKYNKILSQPDYNERLERMYHEQDSVYSLTYKAYNASDFETVFKNVAYIQKNFPLASLMPKFLFLNALSIGKRDSQEKFRTALNDLVTNYPASDVSAMAKDILALMKQGQEAKNGTSSGTLLARREETTKAEVLDITKMKFSSDKFTRHRLMLISKAGQENIHKLQYNVASFNFSRFMIKDFDLVINKLDTARNALSITNFESYDEVLWYLNSIASDVSLSKMFVDFQVQKVIISDENFGLLKNTYSLEDYLAFQSAPVTVKPATTVAATTVKQTKKTEVAVKDVVSKPIASTVTKPEDDKIEKPIAKKDTKVVEAKPTEAKQVEKPVRKPDEKLAQQTQALKPETIAKPAVQPTVAAQPKQDDVPLFKGLFAYRANEPHFIAIYVLNGTVDFEKVKAAFDAYNAKNYSVMNLKVSLEKVDKLQIIIIGSLTDASVAKSYLLRMVKEKPLFDGLKGANYRNLLGSKKNLNVVVQQNALNTYFEFMQEYYLK